MEKTRERILESLREEGKMVIRKADYSEILREVLGQLYEEGQIELIVMEEGAVVRPKEGEKP